MHQHASIGFCAAVVLGMAPSVLAAPRDTHTSSTDATHEGLPILTLELQPTETATFQTTSSATWSPDEVPPPPLPQVPVPFDGTVTESVPAPTPTPVRPGIGVRASEPTNSAILTSGLATTPTPPAPGSTTTQPSGPRQTTGQPPHMAALALADQTITRFITVTTVAETTVSTSTETYLAEYPNWPEITTPDCWYLVFDRLERRYNITVPGVQGISAVCGGLWDNMKQFAPCYGPWRPNCAPTWNSDGLTWSFSIIESCKRRMVEAVWWDATENKWGAIHCRRVHRDPLFPPNHEYGGADM